MMAGKKDCWDEILPGDDSWGDNTSCTVGQCSWDEPADQRALVCSGDKSWGEAETKGEGWRTLVDQVSEDSLIPKPELDAIVACVQEAGVPLINVPDTVEDENQLLGSGASARVYSLDDETCIKVFRWHSKRMLVRRACEEALRLAAVAPAVPAVPRLLGLSLYPPAVVLTRHGQSFKEMLDQDILSEAQVLDVCVRFIAAVMRFHQFGFLHNDLKKNNVVVELDGEGEVIRVTIIDFGMMTRTGEDGPAVFHKYRNNKGKERRAAEQRRRRKKPWYAPELFHQARASEESDVYSVCYLLVNVLEDREALADLQLVAQTGLSRDLTHRPLLHHLANVGHNVQAAFRRRHYY